MFQPPSKWPRYRRTSALLSNLPASSSASIHTSSAASSSTAVTGIQSPPGSLHSYMIPNHPIHSTHNPILYVDVIQCVLQFVDFCALSLLSQLNHSWRHAVTSLKPRKGHRLRLKSFARNWTVENIPSYVQSSLLPHVDTISMRSEDHEKQLSIGAIEQLCLFPHLRVIRMGQIVTHEGNIIPQSISFPTALNEVKVEVYSQLLQPLINGLGELPLLQILHIEYFDHKLSSKTDFHPLLKLTKLQDFFFHDRRFLVYVPSKLTSLLNVVRQMSSLQKFSLGGSMTLAEVQLLAAENHQLHQLQQISLHSFVDVAYTRTLSGFPSLTTFNPLMTAWESADFLHQLPHLTNLKAFFGEGEPEPAIDNLIDCVSTLRELRSLGLGHQFLRPHHLTKLMPHLTQLNDLALQYCFDIYSITCLAPFASQITRFELLDVRGVNLIELQQFTNLTALALDFTKLEIQVPSGDRIVEAVSQFPKLEDLKLAHVRLRDRHLSALLPHLPQLTALALERCEGLHRLTWLTNGLKRLNLTSCDAIYSSDLSEICRLVDLEHLCLQYSLNRPVQVQQLKEMMSSFPKLITCSYTPALTKIRLDRLY